MKEIWQRIDTWLAENAPQVWDELQPGATDQEILRTEKALGIQFPEDVKASYRIHNGQPRDGYGLINCWTLLSLETVVEEWMIWKELLDAGEFDAAKSNPTDGIREDWWNPKWIPLTYSGSGDHHCLDMDPADGGREGQIIGMWHDEPERMIEAESFREWLERFADDLEAGMYIYSEDDGGVIRKEDLDM